MKVRDIMQRHVTVVREDESLAMAQQLMQWSEIRHLPVVRREDDRVVGLLSDRDLLRAASVCEASPLYMDRPVRDFMTSPVEHIHPNAEVADAAADLTAKQLGCLPVIEAGALVGILTRGDVLSVLAQYSVDQRPGTTPRQPPPMAAIMFPEPVAVHAHELLFKAAIMLAKAGVRHACVVDGEGRVIGMLSDRDVRRVLGDPLRAFHSEQLPEAIQELRVETVMTRSPRTVDQERPFTDALPLLVTERMGALPVVDSRGHLRGIVSYVDVLKALAMYVPST